MRKRHIKCEERKERDADHSSFPLNKALRRSQGTLSSALTEIFIQHDLTRQHRVRILKYNHFCHTTSD